MAETSALVHGVRLSSPDRLLYPGITKRDLVVYYEAVAEHLLPHIARRPLTFRRCPRGVNAPCFVQQHGNGGLPKAIRSIPIVETQGETEPHLYIEDLAGLVACAQMSVLELHGWGSRIDDLDAPDRLVFDLDPDPSRSFADVKAAARAIRDRLKGQGLDSWPLLSGGKGLHVVIPLAVGPGWDMVSDFAQSFAEGLAADVPDTYIAAMAKVERKGRIFIDWLRNARGATAIMPFSTRAKVKASIAIPVSWDALDTIADPGAFTVRRILDEGVIMPQDWCAVPQTLPVT